MTWGVSIEPQFGQFFPNGEWVGWRAERIKYFEDLMPDAEKETLDPENMLNSYLATVSGKFSRDMGAILDHEWPQTFRTDRVVKNLAPLFHLNDRVIAVEDSLRLLIEDFEPDVHRFNPIRILSKSGAVYPGSHSVMVIGQFLDSFSAEGSDDDMFERQYGEIPRYDVFVYGPKDIARLAVKTAANKGKHLWREKGLNGLTFLISDELQSAIATAGLKLPPNAKMRAV